MPWKTNWQVFVAGVSATERMTPYLQSITVTDKSGVSSDTCQLVFDDAVRDRKRLKLPETGSRLRVVLEGLTVFRGIIDTVTSSGSRQSGRVLSVGAKGFDTQGKAKQPQMFHQDDGTVGDFLQKAAEKAGHDLKMDDELASIKRKYMSANSESFLALGERLARELGGTFKMQDGKAVLARQGAANGLPEIAGKFTGDASGNLISWNVEPVSSRPKFKDVAVRFFDREAGQVRTHSEHVGDGQVTNAIRSTAQDKAQALGIAAGRKREAQRKGGEGRVVLDLELKAQAEALFRLSGTRPGIDGSYRIVSVTHKADRSGGATTELELRQPHGGAGEDARV